MALTLGLNKGSKLQLSLRKGAKFFVELFWDSKHDLDAHALLATNGGDGAKIDSLDKVLSAYNMKKTGGALLVNPDKTFATPCDSLTHSGDSLTGETKDVDEIVTIDGSKIPSEVNEIPIFVTIHEASTSRATFADVRKAGIRIKDDNGKVLAEYQISNEFARFNAVQFGSLLLGTNGWEFSSIGSGFNGDFNTVLGSFS